MTSKFSRLLFTPDLTEIGVAEVVTALAHPSRQLFLESYDDMRLRVADNIVTLAVRRHLVHEGIPHQAAPAISFSEADRYDIAIGGRRCVPLAQLNCGGGEPRHIYLPEETGGRLYRDVDIYLFVRLNGRVTRSREEIDRAQLAGQPVYLIHQMPENWASPERWVGLDRLALKTDTIEPVSMALYGQDRERAHLIYQAALQPRRRVKVRTGLYALGSVHTTDIPTGPVGLHSPKLEELHLIHPYQWGNIWVYGESLEMMGYITQARFQREAARVPAEAELPNPCLKNTPLLSLPVEALTPAEDLFRRARDWDQNRG
jgi:hypothetical protein